jgi:hypothetical protein
MRIGRCMERVRQHKNGIKIDFGHGSPYPVAINLARSHRDLTAYLVRFEFRANRTQ